MIEVITHVEFILRVPSTETYLEAVNNILDHIDKSKIQLQDIVHITEPTINPNNSTIECQVNGTLLLNIPETKEKQKVDEYIEEIVPFMKRYLPSCNRINQTKIIQMKRKLEDPNIHEYSIKFD